MSAGRLIGLAACGVLVVALALTLRARVRRGVAVPLQPAIANLFFSRDGRSRPLLSAARGDD